MDVGQLPTNQLAGALAVALAAAAAKYAYDDRATRRSNRVKRLDRQLEQLYGPLLALSHASFQAWRAFRQIHGRDKTTFWGDPSRPPTEAEATAWRLWMKHVFMPLNNRIEAVIIEHADLLEESFMPPCLLSLCSHVEAYRGVVNQWDTGDFSRHIAVINYPAEVLQYAQARYTELKAKQARLTQAGA
jgi:hypothetical protein